MKPKLENWISCRRKDTTFTRPQKQHKSKKFSPLKSYTKKQSISLIPQIKSLKNTFMTILGASTGFLHSSYYRMTWVCSSTIKARYILSLRPLISLTRTNLERFLKKRWVSQSSTYSVRKLCICIIWSNINNTTALSSNLKSTNTGTQSMSKNKASSTRSKRLSSWRKTKQRSLCSKNRTKSSMTFSMKSTSSDQEL